MEETPELKRTILEVASELFTKRGYAGTSIKQIAQAAGCTTAALYYYFEGGKANILREVVRFYSTDVLNAIDGAGTFDDLPTYLHHLTQRIGQTMPHVSKRLSWLVFELRNLPDEEQENFLDHFLSLQQTIRSRLEHYVQDDQRANLLAWIIVCAFLGYGQLFEALGFEDPSAPRIEAFGEGLMALIARGGTTG